MTTQAPARADVDNDRSRHRGVDAYVLYSRNSPGGYVNTLKQVASALLGNVPLTSSAYVQH